MYKTIKNIFNRAGENLWEKLKSLLHTKQLLIFVGDVGTYIATFKDSKPAGSLFISGEEHDLGQHRAFLDKYKKYTASVIVDKVAAELYHSQILVAQSLLPVDHVGRFIKKTLDKDDIVANNVFDITNDDASETWHTALMSVKETPVLATLVSYLASNCVKFKGIYFLALNAPNLIRQVSLASKTPISSKLQIFVTLTSFSGIRVMVCHDQDVMESHIVPFPYDKSLEYAQGVIEQSVSDCVISLKNYIHHHQERPSLIILAPKEMQPLLQQSKFDVGQVIILPAESKDHFADQALSYFLNKNIKHKSSNEKLKSFDRATKLSNLFFKPIWLIMMVFVYFLFKNELEVRKNYRKASKVNEQYYTVSEEYRQQREQYPYIDKFGAIVDFHNAMVTLSTPQDLPFDTLDKFLRITPANLRLHSLDWNKDKNMTITAEAKYVGQTSDTSVVLASLDTDLLVIQRSLSDYDIKLLKDSNAIINHGGFVSIPLQLIITKKEK